MSTVAAPHHDEALLRRFAATREPSLREELVRRYLPLARYAAARYARSSQSFEDLVQIASLGLLKAIDRYDPDRASAFTTYALPTMNGELRRYFRDRTWSVRPPRGLQEHAMAVERAADRLTAETGAAPTVDEIATRARLSPGDVLEAREALAARQAVSLSSPSSCEDDEGTLEDRLGAEDGGLECAEARAVIDAVENVLTVREKEIVRLRFEEDLTQRDIGSRVGLSQMQVSRIVRGAVDKLRVAASGGDEELANAAR